MYFEEVDFCLRAARAGWPCWYVPQCRVVHLVGQSSGVTRRARSGSDGPATGSSRASGSSSRTTAGPRPWPPTSTHTLAFCRYRLRRLVQRKPDHDPRWMLRDFIRYNFLPVKPR